MKCKTKTKTKRFLTATVALTILLFLVSNVYAHDISVPTNAYFGCTDYSTYIRFNPATTLNTAYRQNNYWYFNNYGFQIQNGNMTITDYFSNPNYLSLTLTAPSGNVSTTKIYVGSKDQPTTIEINNQVYNIGDKWSFDRTNMVLTLTWTHSSDADVIFDWTPIQGGSPSDTTPPPEQPPPEVPPLILPASKYVVNFEGLGWFLLAVGSVLLIFMGAKARQPKTIEALWRRKVSVSKKSRASPWIPIVVYVLFILVWFLVLRGLLYG